MSSWRDPQRYVEGLLEAAAKAGIGSGMAPIVLLSGEPVRRVAAVDELMDQVEASPYPDGEWPTLMDVLGVDLLQRLVRVGRSSVTRYRSGARTTPDEVAARLHVLALVVADLDGGYNAFGIRRWFLRPRRALGGRAPVALLSGDWDPEGPDARRVAELAAAVNHISAT